MPSYASVAAKVAKAKRLRPADYCPHVGCLWRTHVNGQRISYCAKHEREGQPEAQRSGQIAVTSSNDKAGESAPRSGHLLLGGDAGSTPAVAASPTQGVGPESSTAVPPSGGPAHVPALGTANSNLHRGGDPTDSAAEARRVRPQRESVTQPGAGKGDVAVSPDGAHAASVPADSLSLPFLRRVTCLNAGCGFVGYTTAPLFSTDSYALQDQHDRAARHGTSHWLDEQADDREKRAWLREKVEEAL